MIQYNPINHCFHCLTRPWTTLSSQIIQWFFLTKIETFYFHNVIVELFSVSSLKEQLSNCWDLFFLGVWHLSLLVRLKHCHASRCCFFFFLFIVSRQHRWFIFWVCPHLYPLHANVELWLVYYTTLTFEEKCDYIVAWQHSLKCITFFKKMFVSFFSSERPPGNDWHSHDGVHNGDCEYR